MKSKLTLRFNNDLKERAKRLAGERGISVSQLVESTSTGGRSFEDAGLPEASGKQSGSEELLFPRI